jgi:hypothetical protein
MAPHQLKRRMKESFKTFWARPRPTSRGGTRNSGFNRGGRRAGRGTHWCRGELVRGRRWTVRETVLSIRGLDETRTPKVLREAHSPTCWTSKRLCRCQHPGLCACTGWIIPSRGALHAGHRLPKRPETAIPEQNLKAPENGSAVDAACSGPATRAAIANRQAPQASASKD